MLPKSKQQSLEQERIGRGGVGESVRKQLAFDIHNAGGIQEFDKFKRYALDDLLNKKKLYPVDKKERKQIRNLIYNQWKKWSTEKYHQLVEKPFGIVTEPTIVNSATTPNKITTPNKTTASPPIAKKQLTVSKAKNSMGRRIVTTLPNGLIACIVWVDTKLDNMHVVVSQDGFSIKKATKKPKQETAQDLLSKFSWSRDKNNAVVMALNAELDEIKDDSDPNEATIITVDEEVVRDFYDCNGEPSKIDWTIDDDGYQYITFYLKTVKSFKQSGKGSFKKYDNIAGMDIGGNDDGSCLFEEQTVDEVRAEMNDLRADLAEQHRLQMDINRQQMEQQRLQMDQQRAQMEQQQQQMQQQMQMQMQMIQGMMQHAMPPTPSQPPLPDGAASNHQAQQPVPDGAPSLASVLAQAQAEAAAQAQFHGGQAMQ